MYCYSHTAMASEPCLLLLRRLGSLFALLRAGILIYHMLAAAHAVPQKPIGQIKMGALQLPCSTTSSRRTGTPW
jgi:hypothetical protein